MQYVTSRTRCIIMPTIQPRDSHSAGKHVRAHSTLHQQGLVCRIEARATRGSTLAAHAPHRRVAVHRAVLVAHKARGEAFGIVGSGALQGWPAAHSTLDWQLGGTPECGEGLPQHHSILSPICHPPRPHTARRGSLAVPPGTCLEVDAVVGGLGDGGQLLAGRRRPQEAPPAALRHAKVAGREQADPHLRAVHGTARQRDVARCGREPCRAMLCTSAAHSSRRKPALNSRDRAATRHKAEMQPGVHATAWYCSC